MAQLTGAVLAVDGGNSKTDVALIGHDGAVHAYARGPGSCHQVVGLDLATAVLADLVAKVAAEAGVKGTDALAQHGAFYLAGADLPVEVHMLHGHLAAMGWVGDLVVDNDTFALLRAGTDRSDRVAVVCGAGINCVGVSAAGRVARFPSLGRLSGDWGGGGHLGSEALWLAIRAEDGRGHPTALQGAVAGHFGVGSVADVSAAIHLGDLDPDRLHELVPLLFALSAGGDEVSRDVVIRMGEEVALLASVALRRLQLLDRPADVVLGGGVLASRDRVLLGTIEERLGETAPQSRIVLVEEPPVVGAALLGLDSIRAPRQVEQRVRVELLTRARRWPAGAELSAAR